LSQSAKEHSEVSLGAYEASAPVPEPATVGGVDETPTRRRIRPKFSTPQRPSRPAASSQQHAAVAEELAAVPAHWSSWSPEKPRAVKKKPTASPVEWKKRPVQANLGDGGDGNKSEQPAAKRLRPAQLEMSSLQLPASPTPVTPRSKAPSSSQGACPAPHTVLVSVEPVLAAPLEPLRNPAQGLTSRSRGLALAKVAIEALAGRKAGASNVGRPQRNRLRPLETWRNERVIYKRPPGSLVPCVAGVELNFAPRPADSPPRQLGHAAVQPPPLRQNDTSGIVEFVSHSTAQLETRIFTLPAPRRGQRLPTVALQPAWGQLFVLDGEVRCALEGDTLDGELRLGTGDTCCLREADRVALVAPFEVQKAAQNVAACTARFLWVYVKAPASPEPKDALSCPGAKEPQPLPQVVQPEPEPQQELRTEAQAA